MPDWITISGAVTNVASLLDLGYRYAPYEAIRGKDAGTVLEEVGEILRSTNTVLENEKDYLSPDLYKRLKVQYRTFHWKVIDESQQLRAMKDEEVRQIRSHSQLSTNEESFQGRAIELLSAVESYQTTVLAACRAAVLSEFPDQRAERSSPQDSVSLQQSANSSVTSWFSAFGSPSRISNHSLDVESAGESSPSGITALAPSVGLPTRIVTEMQGYIVAITHRHESPTSSVDLGTGTVELGGSSSGAYRSMVSLESAGRRIGIIDPQLHSLDRQGVQIDTSTMRAMVQLGQRLMNERNAGAPEGCQITSSNQNTSIEAVVKNFQASKTAQKHT